MAAPLRTIASRHTTAAAASIAGAQSRRALSVSAARFLKEDALHTDGKEQAYEGHKQALLKDQKEGKAHWKDELASNSESIVKAERGEIDASEATIKKLQEESARAAKK